jgi:hypothetical protein
MASQGVQKPTVIVAAQVHRWKTESEDWTWQPAYR